MPDDTSQFEIPASFIALYLPAGRIKPTLSRDDLAVRFEWCDDLAQALTETAKSMHWELGITEADVLEKVALGLQGEASGLSDVEMPWVLGRLAELLDWPQPMPHPTLGDQAPGDR